MVAPKTEGAKQELTVKEDLQKEEEEAANYEEEDKPLSEDDFHKRLQFKHKMFGKKQGDK